ncbi:MAG: DUF3450 domain-containing protein [Gammaproteobacteria bacterium]|nr:DUF3450 domain-containing protein [Pseudomonadales bacterium]MCP5348091.1 DUF3450 domain-containing protein [Pseudomonadales bacterium]
MPKKCRIVPCLITTLSLMAGTALAQAPDDVLETELEYQQDAGQSQDRVAALDDETMGLVASYNREIERYQDLETYNENLRQLLDSQQAERNRIQAELGELEVIRQQIVPLIVEMVDVLDQFVTLDQPMLSEERRARVASLRSVIARADVDIAEKYRRVIEAYQIEAEYGQTLEAYEAPTLIDGREVTVDFLRVGRVGLFYLSLDRQQAGIWDTRTGDWELLSDTYLDAIEYAVRVAREQAPPNLIDLPLWTRGTDQ